MNYKFINTEYLDSVSGGDYEIVREIIELFKEQAIEIYNDMNLLLSEKDFHSLGMLAHKAKSSVSIMGMSNLADLLKTFELEARAGKDPDKYGSYIARFGEETKSAITELDDYINNRVKKS
jgi:HPt (histidine-containing phosphotransfer) domain-containing protein